jgi:chromosome segregation ATPase
MIGKPGLPSRTASGPGATIETKALGLLAALGNPDETKRLLEQLKTERLAFEAAAEDATAKVAEASKIIEDADNREQQANATVRNAAEECARLRAVIAAAQADLETDRNEHEAGVKADTEALVKREAAVAEREAAAKAAEAADVDALARLNAYRDALKDREQAVTDREAEMDAREARLKAALG